MKNKLKTYVPWVVLIAIPSVLCTVLYALQLFSANLFADLNGELGFYPNLSIVLDDLVRLCRPLSGIFLCVLAVMRPFAAKTQEFLTGMRWLTVTALLLFSVSFAIHCGLVGLPFNTVWGWLANVLRVSVIPAAVAYLLLRQEKLPAAVCWTLATVVCALMVVNQISIFGDVDLFSAESQYVINTIVIAYCQICPVFFALAPRKNGEKR